MREECAYSCIYWDFIYAELELICLETDKEKSYEAKQWVVDLDSRKSFSLQRKEGG
jgi:hypothetical protein